MRLAIIQPYSLYKLFIQLVIIQLRGKMVAIDPSWIVTY
jgi:hypothetical protein